ncbi:Sec-independent protein translocase protein TatB [Woeseia oceani]|uniref:Twin arginine-targeting protein translocase TatB n=1 Tax=Woeseia oceani TaxID=1548547 RepID=A0A193LK11_9GAMM|nr:Sec-independent protein translocase protein TatB [Woeseia oceani]ANO52847.1 twin arginine-targeting protein translocase TatB [Woeseia oceani]
MSGVGFWELIILLLIGLIVLGPERLPRVANQLGGWLGQARRMTRVMKRQLDDELNFEKHLDIVPPARTQHSSPDNYQAPVADTPPEDDDTYSPAHDKDSAGTGVRDDEVVADAAETAEPVVADTETSADDAASSSDKNPSA